MYSKSKMTLTDPSLHIPLFWISMKLILYICLAANRIQSVCLKILTFQP